MFKRFLFILKYDVLSKKSFRATVFYLLNGYWR